MNRVIIESPYAGDVERNVKYARAALLHSLQLGEAPFASHLLYTQVLDDLDPAHRAQGIQAGYGWIEVADLVAFYADYGWSAGMIRALKVTRLLHKKLEVRRLMSIVEGPPVPHEVNALLLEAQDE